MVKVSATVQPEFDHWDSYDGKRKLTPVTHAPGHVLIYRYIK